MSLSIMMLGFLIGMRHALEADHVAAVASLATQSSSIRQTVRQGMSWGLGHTITLFLFGTISLLIDDVIPEDFAAGLEFAVGIMLILLGMDVLWRIYKKRVHFHIHQHADGYPHFHAHSHQGEAENVRSSHQHVHPEVFPKRALIIGLIHGMAGSAALIILTINTVQSFYMGILYMLLFGIGSISGMAILSLAIAVPLRYSAEGLSWVFNGLQYMIALSTIFLGTLTSYRYLFPEL